MAASATIAIVQPLSAVTLGSPRSIYQFLTRPSSDARAQQVAFSQLSELRPFGDLQ
jgi:hypothetical protein